MKERWKNIIGFEGYQISTHGRLKSLDRKVWNPANKSFSLIKGLIKKQDFKNKNYAQIALCNNGIYHKFLIHRLVALHFVPNIKNLPEVNHKDLNKQNNFYKNLEWTTRLENARHAKLNGSYANMPKGVNKANSILNENAVRHIRKRELRNIDYCRLYNVAPSTVSCLQKDLTRWPHVR